MNNCFFHICTIGNSYQRIVDEIFFNLQSSNIVKDLDAIYVNIAGDKEVSLPSWDQIKLNSTRSKMEDYEFSTLNQLKLFASTNTGNLLYLHTKGASTTDNICIDEWRNYMLYFNIIQYKKALELLNGCDAVGVDLVNTPTLHFSGNMWWSTCKHINSLPNFEEMPLVLSERHKAEFWICSKPNGVYNSLHNSNINVYQRHLTRYPANIYEINN
jgi:hypothetical protein